MKVLLLEKIHNCVSEYLTKIFGESLEIQYLPHSLSEEQLIEKLPSYDIVGIRSKTHITTKVLDKCPNLMAICCFCIGTNQVDLDKCMELNIPVFNSPYMNTRSVAELVISHIVALSRQTYQRNIEMHNKHWNKTSTNCFEIRGKTLGIIGYGHVGSQVSTLAEAMGMNVLFYDVAPVLPLGNSQKIDTMSELLSLSNFVTIHVPLQESTDGLFGKNEFEMMMKGSYLINTSRGSVVDLDALEISIQNNDIDGAALDVYPVEPKGNKCEWVNSLQKYNNVILTPHIGGATEEAQNQIGIDISHKIVNFVNYGSTMGVVNMPEINSNQQFKNGGSVIANFHQNKPGYLFKVNKLFNEGNVNIDKQILSTYNNKGYLLIKISKSTNQEDINNIENVIHKIRELDNQSRTYFIE